MKVSDIRTEDNGLRTVITLRPTRDERYDCLGTVISFGIVSLFAAGSSMVSLVRAEPAEWAKKLAALLGVAIWFLLPLGLCILLLVGKRITVDRSSGLVTIRTRWWPGLNRCRKVPIWTITGLTVKPPKDQESTAWHAVLNTPNEVLVLHSGADQDEIRELAAVVSTALGVHGWMVHPALVNGDRWMVHPALVNAASGTAEKESTHV